MNLSRSLRVALTLVATALAAAAPLVHLPDAAESAVQGALLVLAALGIVPVHLDVDADEVTK